MVIMKAEIKVREEKLHGIKRQEEATVQTGQRVRRPESADQQHELGQAASKKTELSYLRDGMNHRLTLGHTTIYVMSAL